MVLLDNQKSDDLRCKYVRSFVNTAKKQYKENIQQKKMYCDGLCYTGYLWDYLLSPRVISQKEAEQCAREKKNFYIMWDIHSSERILIPDYWKYPKESVLYIETWTDALRDSLPEDIYLFDNTFTWSIVFTHETDADDNPYCLCSAGRRQGDGSPVTSEDE